LQCTIWAFWPNGKNDDEALVHKVIQTAQTLIPRNVVTF